jgi:hypothetical protein
MLARAVLAPGVGSRPRSNFSPATPHVSYNLPIRLQKEQATHLLSRCGPRLHSGIMLVLSPILLSIVGCSHKACCNAHKLPSTHPPPPEQLAGASYPSTQQQCSPPKPAMPSTPAGSPQGSQGPLMHITRLNCTCTCTCRPCAGCPTYTSCGPPRPPRHISRGLPAAAHLLHHPRASCGRHTGGEYMNA